MELYLIRHAHAVKLGEDGSCDDAGRPLSDRGQEQSRALGSVLQKRGIVLDKVFTSPLLRARQTADAIAQVFEMPPVVEECRALAPGGRAKKVARFLFALDGARIGLVGHSPDLEKWAGWLIGSKKVHIELSKAGVAYINCPEGPGKGLGTLAWMLGPEWYLESSIAELYAD